MHFAALHCSAQLFQGLIHFPAHARMGAALKGLAVSGEGLLGELENWLFSAEGSHNSSSTTSDSHQEACNNQVEWPGRILLGPSRPITAARVGKSRCFGRSMLVWAHTRERCCSCAAASVAA